MLQGGNIVSADIMWLILPMTACGWRTLLFRL